MMQKNLFLSHFIESRHKTFYLYLLSGLLSQEQRTNKRKYLLSFFLSMSLCLPLSVHFPIISQANGVYRNKVKVAKSIRVLISGFVEYDIRLYPKRKERIMHFASRFGKETPLWYWWAGFSKCKLLYLIFFSWTSYCWFFSKTDGGKSLKASKI